MLGRWGLGGRGGKERTDLGLVFGVGAAVLALADLGARRQRWRRRAGGGRRGQTLMHSLNSGRRSPADAAAGCAKRTQQRRSAAESISTP